jgi:Cdc6-like AAA superfamily ATPase
MLGVERDKRLKAEVEKIEMFFEKPAESHITLFTGTYGIGKSLMVRNIVQRLQPRMNNQLWKYEENISLLVSRVNCIQRDNYLNGWRGIIRDIFSKLGEQN